MLDFVIVYIFTKSIEVSVPIVVTHTIVGIIAYYIHERVWQGRKNR